MSVLGACWRRPILRKIEEVVRELKQRQENRGASWKKRERNTKKKGKPTPRKEVRKWTNCCIAIEN
jgi:hypothetical protein